MNGGQNQYAIYVEEAGGMESIHALQHHNLTEIYNKSYSLMDKYFAADEEEDVDAEANAVDENTGAYTFDNAAAAPSGGFSFGQ